MSPNSLTLVSFQLLTGPRSSGVGSDPVARCSTQNDP